MIKIGRKEIAIPPGETIKEQLDMRNMTQKEFAIRMNLSEKHVSKLLNGEVLLTHEVAMGLESVFDVPSSVWINLEGLYRSVLYRIEEESRMNQEITILDNYPYKAMAKLSWIKDCDTKTDYVYELRKFFEVSNLEYFVPSLFPRIAARQLCDSEDSKFSLIAFGQKCRLESRNMVTKEINVESLKKKLSYIRTLSLREYGEFINELKEILGNCGIALIILPNLDSSFIHGATFKDKHKIVLGLSLRGKDIDKFWFSLFHEIGHIVLGHIYKVDDITQEDEDAADQFARDILIPNEKYTEFLKVGNFTKNGIKKFAYDIQLDPSIVLGRLQKDSIVPFSRFNDLKKKYRINLN